MKQAFVSEATVTGTPEQVWSALTDWERADEWMAGVDALHVEGPTAPGTRIVFEARGRDRPATILAVDAGRSLVVRSEQGPVRAEYRYEVAPVDADRTTLRLVADCEVRGLLALAAPFVRRSLRRTDRHQPHALARLVETRGQRVEGR